MDKLIIKKPLYTDEPFMTDEKFDLILKNNDIELDSYIIDMTIDIKKRDYDDVIQELMKEHNVEDILNFNETDIQEKLAINSAKIWHFAELYNREKNDYDKIMEIKSLLEGQLYIHYKTTSQLSLKQGEIEKYYIPNDKYIIMLNKIARQQKWRVEFYQSLKAALEKQQWNMTTFLKSIQAGL